MELRRDVFQAIADPTRREILHLLTTGNLNLKAIAENFEMSRQGISLHIRILRECQAITVSQQGRERICEIRPECLREVHEWSARFNAFWAGKLATLKSVVEAEAAAGKKKEREL